MKMMKKSLAALSLVTLASGAQAEITWSNTSVTLLSANEYLNPFSGEDGSGSVLTFANAASYNWGKSFFFVDRFKTDDKETLEDSSYGELNVDFSLTGGKGFEAGLIKDVYVATTWEYAASPNVDNLLIGSSVRWRLPGYAWIDTGLYVRDNGKNKYGVEEDTSYHFASAWGIPFSLGDTKMSLEGFIDLQTSTETNFGQDVPMKIVLQPKLKLDMGGIFGNPGTFFAGLEYDYRKNMYGVDGQDQKNPQLFVEFSL
ncbi:hypothetical protein M0G74_05970 [Microbulbifer sp. CAU 1566]|uniref:outer membrane protein OmpK n=1 Tax=Microbulbifer sp. CAU 1566 TaxID=2933269 RepID=UPI002002A4E4|nr:outer membrane protein OmpK [Microbulbifer sp. CAU 1566]MCK7596816.1 hypothetical protein [Microbulbifer sp. CAU 1566]